MLIGIDLGTTNSVVAMFQAGAAQVIPNVHGHDLTPSVVGLDDDGAVLVGLAARERLITHPHLTAGGFKRYMGSDRVIRLGKRGFRAEELSALVLRSLKADAEAHLGEPVSEAVVTVPAYFNDVQRKATRLAGELAGLKVERLLNEPTAAALAYGIHRRDAESQYLVFDLGGGTFDVSLLELFEGVMEVRASAGDNFLGGDDFVGLMVDGFLQQAGLQEVRDDRELLAALREQCERAKRQLSSADEARVAVRHRGGTYEHVFDAAQFERLAEPLLQRIRAPVERALRDAQVRPAELHEVVLVGGATRMPVVRRLVSRMFGRIPAATIDPDRVVALGAAVQAGLKARDQALDEVVLTDVSPYTLGVDVAEAVGPGRYTEGHFLPVIERNTTIPASRTRQVTTIRDGQRSIELNVYQGEARLVRDNIHLGAVTVQVPPRPAGEQPVEVRFTYDINGLLEVEATVLSTGKVERIVIEGNPGVLSKEEVQARLQALAKLKVHPRDQDENRALLARGDRLHEEHLGQVREAIRLGLARFAAVLEEQNPRTIREARRALAALFDEIEGAPYL